MSLRTTFATLPFIALVSYTSLAQCIVKEAVKPSVFISYEAATGPRNDRTTTLLRLHNNTNCTIVIETSDLVTTPEADRLFKKITKRDADCSIATTYIPDPPEGAFLPVFYDKQQTIKHRPQPANYYETRDLINEYYVPGGRSITFAVDAKLFHKRFLFFCSVHLRMGTPARTCDVGYGATSCLL